MKPADCILVYDDNCPLCDWYSSLFVKYGFLGKEGRQPFSTLQPSLLAHIDFDKSRNEIPLINVSTGHTLYGIDALLFILGQRMPLISRAGNITPIKWLLKKLYKFISYNRKVIVARKCNTGAIDCAPDLNYFYRIFFMMIFLVFNTLMLLPVYNIILSRLPGVNISATGIIAGHFGLLLINCISALSFSKQKAIDYLGQANMLALIAILLLVPLLVLAKFVDPGETFISAYIIIVAIFIFQEYLRRMEYAGILPHNKWIASLNLVSMSGFVFFLFI
jgi:predicted DCC family thiol-disulfide oxidoreductase YuxK